MRKIKITLIVYLCVLALPFIFGGDHEVFATSGNIGVYVDGQQVAFPDAKPYIENSTTMVPVRFVTEKLGASVTWDNKSSTVSIKKGTSNIELVIDKSNALVNGTSYPLGNAPTLQDGRTMVPLRLISEHLGTTVGWNADSKSVTINSGKSISPSRSSSLARAPIEKAPAPTPAPVQQPPIGEQVVSYAKQYIGTPYRAGGATPNGFDCSGFTHYVMKNFGVDLPRSSGAQIQKGTRIAKSDLKAGDLVFFTRSSGSSTIGHVGIYIANDQFIHSPKPGDRVKITSMSNSYFKPRYYGATRLVE